ncbi:MAG: hypothetical protein ACR2NN_21750 [Bryobacteraceae bacterium]
MVRSDLSAAYVRFASVEQVPGLLAEGGVLGIRHWNESRSESCSTFLQRRKLLKMFWFRLSKWHWAKPPVPLSLFVLAAALFLLANRGAYKGYFQDDDFDNLTFTREIPGSEFAKYSLLPSYVENNFRPVGHVFYRWMGRAAGFDFPPYIFAIHAFHLVNVILLWFIMLRLGLSRTAAGVGALFFIFHMAVFDVYWKPMYVFDLLCCTFCLVSLLLYIKDRWIVSLPFFLIAYHAKEVAIMLPAVLAAYEFLLGQRRWKRLIPFLLISAYISGQAFLYNLHKGDTSYTLHFDPVNIRNCILFYSRYLFLIPYAGFAVLLFFLMFRDRRVLFGILSFCLLLLPMLLLPGRLFSAYLYVPLTGLAIAVGAFSARLNPAIVALFFLIWLPWNYVNMRWLRRTALADVADRRVYVRGLMDISRAHPDILTFLYSSGPVNGYGTRGVLRIIHPGQDVHFTTVHEPDSSDLLRSESLAILEWDSARHQFIADLRTKEIPDRTYIQMGLGTPLWQLERGWHDSEDHFRWTDPLATARLRRPAGAKQFELVVTVGDDYIQKLKTSHVTVSLNGTRIGEHDFTRAGARPVRWDLTPTAAGTVEVIIQTTPEFHDGTRMLGSAVAGFGFLPRQDATK